MAQAPLSAKERFLSEAPQKWQEYRAFAHRLQGTWKHTAWARRGGEWGVEDRVAGEVKQCGPWTFGRTDEIGPQQSASLPYASVRVVNSKYAFLAQRKKPGNRWMVTELDLDLRDNQPIDPHKRQESVLDAVCPLLRVERRPLPEMFRDPTFMIKDARTVERGGEILIEVTFAADYPKPNQSEAPRLEGTVLLDPDRYWVIKESRVEATDLSRYQAALELEYTHRVNCEGFPVPVSVIRQTTYPSGVVTQAVSSYDFREQRELPEIEFSLTAFDLPEPPGIRFEQGSRWLFWLLLGAAVGLTAAFGVRRYARRGSAMVLGAGHDGPRTPNGPVGETET